MMSGEQTATRALRGLMLAFALWFTAAFLTIACLSLTYPFPLEWIEGQSMDMVRRASLGQPLYTEPAIDYVALLYTPLFYVVSAFASHFIGMDFLAGRLVSFLAILGTGAVCYRWARREGGSPLLGFCAAGLLWATYRLSGRWFDLARVDSLALYVSFQSLYLLRFGQRTASAITCGLLITAAFFTKQTTLGLLIPVALATCIPLATPQKDTRHKYFSLIVLAVSLITLAVAIALYNHATDGWFTFFTFTVPAGHRINPVRYWSFWKEDLVEQQGFVLLASLLALWHWWRASRPKALFYAGLLLAAIASTYASRLHYYGYINNIMPLHASLALMAALSAITLPPRLALVAASLIIAQFASLLYDPAPLIPTPLMTEKGEAFLKELSAQNGDIFMPDVQFIPGRVGKKSWSYGMGAYDVIRADLGPQTPIKTKLVNALQTAIAEEKFDVIIPGRLIHYNLPGLTSHYRVAKEMDYPEGYALDSMNLRRMVFYVPIHPKP